ncbi:4-hydroxy-tetrahydrodipicolinate reductase [Verrucomicrobia bacterium]|nr:4-hydroxy-tetrahydrodipicolinate reductase [Verrucomicrobiota bacterium]MDC0268075.1 4-hydroxy-tetrahydrodipicolinate reductase [bacterium]MDG1892119.1 4-hydroxy-tetrahydrodipicolinate reductase [Verrucomicrobiota bacterium]
MTNIIITGSKGRMGEALVRCAKEHPTLCVVGQIDMGDELLPILDQADAIIDFSFHEATCEFAEQCAKAGKALIIGTTGHKQEDREAILSHAENIPIVWASNYSTGVNTLFWLTRKATEILGPDFDLEVVEMHHRMKRDAPSGTATTLVEILAKVRQLQLQEVLRHGREGIVGARTHDEIGMHSMRGGDVVGDHTVVFATPGERVELTHKASSRDTFANGALRASAWAVNQGPGLYSMQDVLGLT